MFQNLYPPCSNSFSYYSQMPKSRALRSMCNSDVRIIFYCTSRMLLGVYSERGQYAGVRAVITFCVITWKAVSVEKGQGCHQVNRCLAAPFLIRDPVYGCLFGGDTYVTNSSLSVYKILCPLCSFLNIMALKKVRFAYANTYHRHSLPPKLSYSTSTLTSSLAPVTPPNATLPLPLPYGHPHKYPLPGYPPRPEPHRYFEPNAIQWSLDDHYSTATRLSASRHHHCLSEGGLFESACTPPLPVIRIFIHMPVSFAHPHPFWICEVRASNEHYVTVLDVLRNLYKFLRGNVSQLDFNTLLEEDRKVATHAYQNRYRRYHPHDRDTYLSEKCRGMKRIDFMMGNTRFVGLSERRHPHEFDLHVTRHPTPPQEI
jgi:hypothetical protein